MNRRAQARLRRTALGDSLADFLNGRFQVVNIGREDRFDNDSRSREDPSAAMTAESLAQLPPLDLAELQGRLLARQPLDAIAARFQVSPEVVQGYRVRYFNFEGQSDWDLIAQYVAGPNAGFFRVPLIFSGCLGEDPGVQIRYFAHRGGLQVMERILEVIRDPDREFDLSTLEGVEAAKSWLRVRYLLMIHSIDFLDPVVLTKRPVFERLLRQTSRTAPRRGTWKPLRGSARPARQAAAIHQASVKHEGFIRALESELDALWSFLEISSSPGTEKPKRPRTRGRGPARRPNAQPKLAV